MTRIHESSNQNYTFCNSSTPEKSLNSIFWQSQGWKIKHLTSITWRRQELKDGAWQVRGLLVASFMDRLGMLYFTFIGGK